VFERISRGWSIAKESWAVLKKHPTLLVLPVLSAIAFVLLFGWLTRHIWWILTSLVVLFVYGGILLGAMPVLDRCGGVSWQGHLCGALAGGLAAYLLSRPEREARQRRRRRSHRRRSSTPTTSACYVPARLI